METIGRKHGNRNIKRNVIKLYFGAFFGSWAFATGILIFHYRELGFSFFQIFLISIIYESLNFILEIPTGALADLWSLKKTITIGYLISGLSFFIVLIDPEAYMTYIIWSILSAICTTLNSGSVSAFTYNTMQEIDSDQYPKVLSRILAISLFTQATTIIIGGTLSDRIGFTAALLISGIGGILQTIIFTTTIEPRKLQGQINIGGNQSIFQQFTNQIKVSFSILFQNRNVRFFLVYGIIFFIIAEFTGVIFQPYLAELGFSTKSVIGFFSAGSLLIMAISSLLVGRIKTHKNEINLLMFLTAGLCFSLILLIFPRLGVPAFIILYLCIGAAWIVLSDIMNRLIPSDRRATILSAQNQLSSISYAFMAILAGALIDSLGIKFSSLIIGILFALSFLFLFSRNNLKEIMKY